MIAGLNLGQAMDLPFTVIGGYLGAGKTTLLNHLLTHTAGLKLAVLVNDFGSVNIDAALIRRHDGETLELANGCLCCSLVDGLAQALGQIRARAAAFDVDPDKVGRVFAGRRCYALDKLESVVADLLIRILVLTSRPEGLQEIIDRGAHAGIRSFLNFVPKSLQVPDGCFVEHIDISAKLEKLSFLSRMDQGRAGSETTQTEAAI